MNNGKNAKDEIFKLHSILEDYNNQTRKEESLIFNEQLNNSMTYFSQENFILEKKRTSLDNKTLETGKGPLRYINKTDI